jgi:hypothetical protein
MSNTQKTELDLELEFLPAWAKESSNNKKKYENFRGDEESRPRGRGGRRPFGGGSGSRPGGRDQRGGDRRPPRRDGGSRDNRGPRSDRGSRDNRGSRGNSNRGPRRGPDRRDQPAPPPVDLDIRITPEPAALDNIARQIRVSGRAYPVFDIARLILKSPERFLVEFAVQRKGDQVLQPLFQCELDSSVWLSEANAMSHLLNNHFDTFYLTEKTPTDPPKGTYTFVSQCGMSGVILGPPNYHDYQKKLVALHQERFARMPFEMFKSRVKIVRDEAVVKQWIEELSFKTEYTALNVPEEIKLSNETEVADHFRKTHLPNVVKSVEVHRMLAKDAQGAADHTIRRISRSIIEDQRRFPLKVVNLLCEEFAKHQLQFFKKDKTVTHVSVSRPHYLDMVATPVSDGVKAIIEFIDEHKPCTRRLIFDGLAPTKVIEVEAPPAPAVPAEPEAKVEPEPPATEAAETPAEEKAGEAADAPAAEAPEQPKEAAKPERPAEPEMSPEQQAVNGDLHWLVHQGHVIEFSNGVIETAKKPRPRPEQQPKKKKAKNKGPRPRKVIVFTDAAPILI